MPVNTGIYGVNPGKSRNTEWDRLPTFNSGPNVPLYEPKKVKVATEPVGDPLRGVGSVQGDITDPAGTAQQAVEESTDVFKGLKTFLFGAPEFDVKGSHGGMFGDVPLLGDVGRFGTEVVANTLGAGGAIVGGTLDVAGGALEHVSLGVSEDLQATFNRIPDSDPNKIKALELIAKDGNNTGAFGAAGHYMAAAIKAYKENLQQTAIDPSLTDNLFMENASLADTVSNLFGGLGWTQRVAERGWAGMATPGQGGRNRLQTIIDVGDGKIAFNEDKGILGTGLLAGGKGGAGTQALNEVELHVYNMVKQGVWDENDALNFLASHNAGISHAASAQIAGTLAIDPLNIAALGAGAIAKAGTTGVALLRMERVAQEGLALAKTPEQIAQATKLLEAAQGGLRSGDSVGRLNALGQIGKMKLTGDVARTFGAFYEAVGTTRVGKVAKIARTIIDPLHLYGDNPRIAKAIEEGSSAIAETMARTHGYGNLGALSTRLATIPGVGAQALDDFDMGIAIYTGNVFRRLASRRYQAVQAWRGALRELREGGKQEGVMRGVRDALKSATKDMKVRMEEEIGSFIKYDWAEDDLTNLARRAERMLGGGMDEAAWREWIDEVLKGSGGAEQLSMLHASTYGLAVRGLHRAIEDVRVALGDGSTVWTLNFDPNDLILLNRQTLTDLGLRGIKDRIGAANGDTRLIMQEIEDAKSKYAELRVFTSDPTSEQATIRNFNEFLDNMLPRLPHQIENSERGQLPAALADFDRLITPDPENGVFTLGFKPKAEFRWGIEEDATGALHTVGDPWYEQVSDVTLTGMQTFRGVRELAYNTAGMPLGPLVSRAARVLDAGEAAGKTLFRGVTGTMVTQAAHKKFVARLAPRLRSAGLTEAQAEEVWTALRKAVDARQDVSGMRGLSSSDMWKSTRDITRNWPSSVGYGPRELMLDIMYAYEGDLRTVGLTQKFTGRVKRMAAQYTDRNWAGAIAEHVWPMMKFRYNPIFQLQEKIEPWVLNAQRGAHVAAGRTPTELDRMTAALYRKYLDSNLVAMADQDIAELSAKFAIGSELEMLSMDRTTAISTLRSRLSIDAILDVQGTKRLNMLRTFRKGLAKDLRGTWDRHLPGEFDKMLDHARTQVGYMMDEDEFAVRMVTENLAANDVTIRTYKDANGNIIGWDADIENAIRTGWESAPQHMGEIRALDINRLVRRMGLEGNDGFLIGDEMGLRRALASGNITMERVERELRELGAHPEYIQRVQSALRFNWNDFWRDVKAAFSLDDDEVARLKDFYGRAAERRGMTPVEYLSQVYSPSIARNGEGAVGSLGDAVELMRNGQVIRSPQLAVLAAGQNADAQALYAQMARVAVVHMDPSGKAALIRALIGTSDNRGPLYTMSHSAMLDSIDGIEDAIKNDEVADLLGRVLMDYFQGSAPTGPAVQVAADADPALAFIRNDAMAALTREGRPPRVGRFVAEDSIDIQREAAAEIANMHRFESVLTPGEVRSVKVTDVDAISREPVAVGVGAASLKKSASHLPIEIKRGYSSYVAETRRLYRHIVDDLGIKVYSSGSDVPYATADALRADLARVTPSGRKGARIKVRGDDNWHPVMTEEDVFMSRVVHAVYGHGQEANAFGADDAFFRTAQMYSQDARGTMLMDTWGQRASALHSPDPYVSPTMNPTTVDEFEATFGTGLTKPGAGPSASYSGDDFVTRNIGNPIRALPERDQVEVITAMSRLRREFSNAGEMTVSHITKDKYKGPGGAPIAATFSDSKDPTKAPHILYIGEHSGLLSSEAAGDVIRAGRVKRLAQSRAGDVQQFPGRSGGGTIDVRVIGNAGSHTGATPTSDMFHEYGHVVDRYLHGLMDDARKAKIEARIAELRAADPSLLKSTARTVAEAEFPYDDFAYTSPRFKAIYDRFRNTNLRYMVSGYANVPYSGKKVLSEGDLFAEVFDLAFNDELEFLVWQRKLEALRADPNAVRGVYDDHVYGQSYVGYVDEMHDPTDIYQRSVFVFPNGTLNEGLIDAIGEWREALKADGVWTPDAVPPSVASADPSLAGKTIGEINSAAPGTVPVEPRYGQFSPDFTDRMMKHYLGSGRFSESNPDLARFAHHTRNVMAEASASFFSNIGTGMDEVFYGQPPSFSWGDVFGENSGLPHVEGPNHFNYTEGLLWDAAAQSMAAKWEDAFRLQYFAQNRSMLQRSINHPMFGLYPASYMWGKVGPELIKFIALQPFGMNTGVGARMLGDVQMSIGMQRTYDEEFDKRIEELGHSASLDFLSYLLPATPWSVPASYPSWMRSFAQQGLEMQAAIEQGKPTEGIDWVKPMTDTVKRVVPALTYVPWMGRAAQELSGVPSEGSPEYKAWLAEQMAKAQAEGRVTPLATPGAPQGEEPATQTDLSQPVQATQIGPTLQQQMQELSKLLGK